MSDPEITAHARMSESEAQGALLLWFDELGFLLAFSEPGLLIAWLDDAIDFADEGFAGSPSLVLEAQIHRIQEGVQVRCSIRHGEGPLAATLAAETARALQHSIASDRRWVVDGLVGKGLVGNGVLPDSPGGPRP